MMLVCSLQCPRSPSSWVRRLLLRHLHHQVQLPARPGESPAILGSPEERGAAGGRQAQPRRQPGQRRPQPDGRGRSPEGREGRPRGEDGRSPGQEDVLYAQPPRTSRLRCSPGSTFVIDPIFGTDNSESFCRVKI